MPKKRAPSPKPKATTPLLIGGIALLVVALFIGAVIYFNQTPAPASPSAFAFGAVTYCRIVPPFAARLGFNEASILDAQSGRKGLVLYNPTANGSPPADEEVYQAPTWDDAGYLGPLTTDKAGNIYVAPVPHISLYDNPPEQQNTVYKVDAQTGVMAAFVSLLATEKPSRANPYGILGLTYDCDTNSLYVSSVAGSTLTAEHGAIYRIDLVSGQVASTLKDKDAFGIGVFNGVSGKRLYFGSARTPNVKSVALSAKGDFAGVPRTEFSIAGWGPQGDDRARRIVFDVNAQMTVRGTLFEYNLIASSERVQTEYLLKYDTRTDTWQPLEDYGR